MKLTHLVVGSALALVVGCSSDKTTGPTLGASGSLSFSFTGGTATSGSGTFSANGAVPATTTTSLGTTSWAAADKNTTNQSLEVVASVPRTSTTWDLAVITVAGLTPGTYPISATCSANVCTDVSILFGTNVNDTNFQFICSLTSGTVVVTSVSATRTAGTFSGSGDCFSAAGATSNFTLASGQFDAGLSSQTLPSAILGSRPPR